MHGGLDALHGEVGALDDAQLDGRPAARPAGHCPLGQRPLHAMRVGQIGLEDDARAQRQELRLVEDLRERGDGEVEVAVLLHVEVDELRGDPAVGMGVAVAGRRVVEPAQALGHLRHRGAKRHEVDLAEHRRHLDRDVLDVVAGEEGEIGLHAPGRLRLAEDRLAQLIQIEPHAVAAPLCQIARELAFLAGQDDVLGLVAEARHDGRHHEAREVMRHRATKKEGDALPPVHVLRHAVAREEMRELIGDALGPVAAEGLVGQGDGQPLAVRIRHHARELGRARVLLGRLLRARLAQQGLGQLDGAVGEGLAHPAPPGITASSAPPRARRGRRRERAIP
jgi:hypothetical protein